MTVVPDRMREFRDFIASRFIGGAGIEIGPGNSPVRLPPGLASARYVDMAPIEDLMTIHHMPDGWVAPDIVDDAEKLSSFEEGSLDFLIACHVIEHTQDPVRVMRTWLNRLRPNGVVFMAVPDKRFSFDIDRPLTPAAHIIGDYLEGAHHSEDEHLFEWATVVNKLKSDAEIAQCISEMKRLDLRPHYHVWNMESFLDLILECRGVYLDFELEFCGRNDTEALLVLRKPLDGMLSQA